MTKATQAAEVAKTIWTNHYLCDCGEEWFEQHECCCNDRCPACRKEIEPFISNDGTVTVEQIDAAREATQARLNLCCCADCGCSSRAEDLEGIKHLSQRVLPGDTMPDGQCPECGALSYLVRLPESLYVVVHEHEYGMTVYQARATREPTVGELVKALKIDFDEEKGETLHVVVPETPVRIGVA